jgi:hypothetical protein
MGSLQTEISSIAQQTSVTAETYVVNGGYRSLLSYQTAVDLDIIPTIRLVKPAKTDEIVDEFSDTFEGIGKIKDVKLEIHVDESKIPIAQAHRRIPFHMQKKLTLN